MPKYLAGPWRPKSHFQAGANDDINQTDRRRGARRLRTSDLDGTSDDERSYIERRKTPTYQPMYVCSDCGYDITVDSLGNCVQCGLDADLIYDSIAEAVRLLSAFNISQVASNAQQKINAALRCLRCRDSHYPLR